jgi:hypothetical protein
MSSSSLHRRSIPIVVGSLTALLLSQVATAAVVPVDDIVLTGADAKWDVTHDFDYDTSGAPCMSTDGGYTIEGGEYGTQTDAFDGGLYLEVGKAVFDDEDGNGTQTDQQLRVGPTPTGGLVVTRTDVALQGTPTLRTLIRLENLKDVRVTKTITWDSALGADDDEKTRASSAEPFGATTADDDWIVASDSKTSPSDPTVTFAVYGRGDIDVEGRAVPWAPEDPDPADESSEGCVVFRFRVSVPAGQTRYLVFFTEFRDTNEKAIATADRFGRVQLPDALLEGIGPKVAARVLNWNLG